MEEIRYGDALMALMTNYLSEDIRYLRQRIYAAETACAALDEIFEMKRKHRVNMIISATINILIGCFVTILVLL